MFPFFPVVEAQACFANNFLYPKSTGISGQTKPSIITAIDTTGTVVFVGGHNGDSSYLPSAVNAASSQFPFLGAFDEPSGTWLWRI